MVTESTEMTAIKNLTKAEIIADFKTCCISREASLLARKEVLTGKAKFGITGDGKEVPQVVMARFFKNGDFRSGYYRDQTFLFATGLATVEDFFAQLYSDPYNDPFSGGRQMNAHFATPYIDAQGNWVAQKDTKNISSDISPTAGQMARALGLALASKFYRNNPQLQNTTFSNNGDEVCFCTIGDASTSEGVFWETLNAACVLKVPLAVSVWDDGYGISVPIEYQTTKSSISEALAGFKVDENGNGMEMYTGYCWDYAGLFELYGKAIEQMRQTHLPALLHIKEVTQPQGHSTSGSHERYKSKERLQWEVDMDCIKQMRRWMVENEILTDEEAETLQKEAKIYARDCKNRAWKAFQDPIKQEIQKVNTIYDALSQVSTHQTAVAHAKQRLEQLLNPLYREIVENVKGVLRVLKTENSRPQQDLEAWLAAMFIQAQTNYHSHLHLEGNGSALEVPEIPPVYHGEDVQLNAYEILNQFFDKMLLRHPELMAFGEDVGNIGDVNQGFAGLQAKHGEMRVFDTGIREWTIIGQGIGLAMRGLRPIAEIQYLDYLIYGLAPLSDDLATLLYRSNGIQIAPMIVRSRGHRLEGIWHSGSPMGMILHALRGMHILVPRNATQAAGMYNTLLQAKEPALLVECLNGYRLKERVPSNLGDYTVPLGVPEILQTGTDVTVVSYGSTLRIVQEAVEMLADFGASVELIDAQTLQPFDRFGIIGQSLKKTNRLVVVDEDVPGGATAFMLQEIIEKQKGYFYLDSQPITITAQAHRPPYGSDGDYFSKPNAEEVFERVYALLNEAEPSRFPKLYFLK